MQNLLYQKFKFNTLVYIMLLMLSGVAVMSCQSYKKKMSVSSIDVTQRSKCSSIFSDYSYVQLETSDDCILSEVKSLEVSDNLICAQCADVIYIFNRNGRFVSKINKKGLGNGEYINITDFKINEDEIWVLSSHNKAILVYTKDAQFVRKISLEDNFASFCIYNNSICLSSASANNQKFNFVFFDPQTEEVISKYDEFAKNESMVFEHSAIVGWNGDTLHVTHPFDYRIYSLTKESFEVETTYEFNTKEKLPENSLEADYYKMYEQTINKNVVCHLTNTCRTKDFDYLIFPLFGDYGILYNIVQLKNNEQQNFVALEEETDSDYPYLSTPFTIYDNQYFSLMDASAILYIEKNNKLSFFQKKNLKEEDNPVLFIHKLR